MAILRTGVNAIFRSPDSDCRRTAPELYQGSAVFVTLSLAAWSTIVVGYLGPFCFVAVLLTRNGYSPSADNDGGGRGRGGIGDGTAGVGRGDGEGMRGMGMGGMGMGGMGMVMPGVFPVAYSDNAAPPGTADRLRIVLLDEFPEDYPKDCCVSASILSPSLSGLFFLLPSSIRRTLPSSLCSSPSFRFFIYIIIPLIFSWHCDPGIHFLSLTPSTPVHPYTRISAPSDCYARNRTASPLVRSTID